ncbi:MAG: hypothetical protein NTX08_02550 [Sphingobacteriales bacterium]|nr:hypothetical protein [Sphingobacteriales bacterium]
MSKKIITIALILVTTCMVLITGCYKVTTLTLANNEEVTRPVSLATDIIPVFTASCSISGCHNSGGIKPDLSAEKVYNTLIIGNYVDLGVPENSTIYLWMTGKKTTIMPVGAANNPSNINQLVLAWIKQGAKNN